MVGSAVTMGKRTLEGVAKGMGQYKIFVQSKCFQLPHSIQSIY